MSDKQHVMGAAAEASEPALLAPLPEPVPVSASGDGQAQGRIPKADGSNWTSKTVAVWEVYYCGDYVAYKETFYGAWHLKDRTGNLFSAGSLQEVMARAEDLAAARRDFYAE